MEEVLFGCWPRETAVRQVELSPLTIYDHPQLPQICVELIRPLSQMRTGFVTPA
jgi:hypothetical protein